MENPRHTDNNFASLSVERVSESERYDLLVRICSSSSLLFHFI
jgi:hypothetical protein